MGELVEELTLPQVARKLEKYIMALPAAKSFNTLSSAPREAMITLSDGAFKLRTAAERYFHADDSGEQQMFLEEAIIQADKTGEAILAASQYDLLGPADVAHLSALAEDLRERLQ